MKRLSIKLKITLYFTLVMIALASVLLVYTTTISKNVAKNELYEIARESVTALSESVRYKNPRNEDGPKEEYVPPPMGENKPDEGKRPPSVGGEKPTVSEFEVPEDAKFTNGDVFLCIYQIKKNSDTPIIHGALPEGLVFNTETAKNEQKTMLASETDKYYVYVKQIRDPGNKDEYAWVVGAINAGLSSSFAHGTLKLAVIAVPFVILVAALLGYAITRRAFRPVSRMTAAAAEIAGSNDLSRRIKPTGNGKDELSMLAETFDGMLDTIQHNYEKERQFTDDASHELRTPVAVIMAQSELALNPNATEEDRKEALEAINKQSHKMRKILSELLALARADNNRTVIEKESFDLTELAEIIIDEEKSVSQCKNIEIKLTSKEPTEVFADKTAIMSVLMNLINNAVKYGKDGGVVVVSIEKHGENGARCVVRDNGIGISEENLGKIWDRFFRVDASRTDDGYSSIGLGLPMAKSIIEAHGGSIRAESVLGEGSIFEFTF